MEFYINKNSTLPNLKMELINDGRNDFRMFHEKIQNATIKFTMYDELTNVKVIANSDAEIELKDEECKLECDPEYYIVYKWKTRDTKKAGRYVGEFKITFLDDSGTLIVPIREELFINILD
jgi:hypothetical protein